MIPAHYHPHTLRFRIPGLNWRVQISLPQPAACEARVGDDTPAVPLTPMLQRTVVETIRRRCAGRR